MARPSSWRTRAVGTTLDEQEYRELRAICDALRLTVRDILLIGLGRARVRLAEEQRKPRGNGHR
jgi:hypothetical protein